MTVGSLFSGIEGFGAGFEQEGFTLIWTCESDPNCQQLLKAKFPNASHHDDVKSFKAENFQCPDVITFGFPCQDLSVAGKRSGLKNGETRSGLFYEATRIIAGFVPRGLQFSVAENVPGIFSSNGGRDFASVVGTLGQCGALDIAWATLDSQWFGLAQRRKRVFIVADFRGRRAEEILSLRESLCGNPAPSREARKRVAPSLESRAGRSGETNFRTSGGLVESPTCANPIGAHHPRNDLDNETYAVIPIQEIGKRQSGTPENGTGYGKPTDPMFTLQSSAQHGVAHALRADGFDGSEDGTGRGTPLVVAHGQANAEIVRDGAPSLTCNHEAPICIQEVGKRVNDDKAAGSGFSKPDDPMFTLQSSAQYAVAVRTSGNCGPFIQDDKTAALNTATDPSQNIVMVPTDVVAFKASHFTRDKDGAPSEVAPPLSADADKGDQDTLIGFSCKDHGNDAISDVAPTMRSMNHDKSHSNGGGQVAIAFKPNQGAKSRSLGASEQVSPTLESATGGNNKPAVATKEKGDGVSQSNRWTVRRLTPT